ALLVRKLAPNGRLHLATDWQDYAEQMWDVLDATAGLVNRAGPRGHVPRPEWRPQTHFETRVQRLGHGVWDLLYDRRGTPRAWPRPASRMAPADPYRNPRPAPRPWGLGPAVRPPGNATGMTVLPRPTPQLPPPGLEPAASAPMADRAGCRPAHHGSRH